MKISITDEKNYAETIEVGSVEELGKVACTSTISTSVFRTDVRNIENFDFAECIGLDVDNDGKNGTPTLSLEDAKKIFQGFKHLILTTRSHGIEKNGVVADRFRIVLFLKHPIRAAQDFYATWFWLKDQFPWIDRACKDPARFWFQHGRIEQVNEEGILVTPIQYTPPEKSTKENRTVLPGERGQLARSTLEFLAFGAETGGRNDTVYRVARDFNQALFEYEEAVERILATLEFNEVFANDFTEAEAKQAIESAYCKDAKHAPRLLDIKPRAFTYQRLGDLLAKPEKKEDWLIEGMLLKGGMSVVVGIPKIGKTTLIRQLEKCILRGEPFLDRKTQQGLIAHYSFDEKEKTATRHYKTMGMTDDDNLILHFGAVANLNYLEEFAEDIVKLKPVLAVVDTLFDMVDADDVNNYIQIKRKLSSFSNLAEKAGCHIMFIHHQNKPNQNYAAGSGHSVLGSTAIFGSVDCCLIFEEDRSNKSNRTITTKGRDLENFDTICLSFDKEKMIYYAKPKPEHFDFEAHVAGKKPGPGF